VRAGRVRFLLTHIPGHEAKDVVGGLTDPRGGHQRGPGVTADAPLRSAAASPRLSR